ncbi:hypothetical protein E2C01_090352 [Portunus trituberculatus]|uniref:Uncharacterized protein n=1 Tax=Portunus trituberculatus TaxID=210409 RepID=A0A5B7JKN5_PORTR|nr:hypothetical protein [Portunus trituberculatus]
MRHGPGVGAAAGTVCCCSQTRTVVMALSKVQDDTGLPKWKVALAVGGTLAAGYAMYYFIFKQPSEKQEKKKTIPKQTSDEAESLTSPNTEDTAHIHGFFCKHENQRTSEHKKRGKLQEAARPIRGSPCMFKLPIILSVIPIHELI